MYFHYFFIISHWKRAGPFIWKKLESSLLKEDLCQIWLRLARRFWRRRFLKFVNVFRYLYLSPLEKGQDPSFVQILIPFTQRWLVPSLVEMDPKKKIFNKFVNVVSVFHNYLPFGSFLKVRGFLSLHPIYVPYMEKAKKSHFSIFSRVSSESSFFYVYWINNLLYLAIYFAWVWVSRSFKNSLLVVKNNLIGGGGSC